VHIDYASGTLPVLGVKLQEMFGLIESPRLADGRSGVLIHLLSPARRPLAVTQDLKSFWTTVYPEIRKQMRADYPKHPWPEDPLTATPTKKTNRALKRNYEC
jgi:ATP-dependent helicase HrpB